jgi:hypothetical protein
VIGQYTKVSGNVNNSNPLTIGSIPHFASLKRRASGFMKLDFAVHDELFDPINTV